VPESTLAPLGDLPGKEFHDWDRCPVASHGVWRWRSADRDLLDKHSHLIATGKCVHATVKRITIATNKRAFFRFEYTDGGFCNKNYKAYRFQFIAPNLTHKFIYDPTGLNHGVVTVCKGSEKIKPVTATVAG
jgi:hypothetical protein